MLSQMLFTHSKEEEEDEVATRDDTREMSILRRGGMIGAKLALTLPPTAGVRTIKELEIRMTATIVEKKVI